MRIDRAVGAEVNRRLQPLGVWAALSALAAGQAETREKLRQIELALEQARYEAALAQRQYDAVGCWCNGHSTGPPGCPDMHCGD